MGLVYGALCISLAPIFAKISALSASQIGFYRCFIATIILYIFLKIKKTSIPWKFLMEKKSFWIWIASISFALNLYVWHTSINMIGAGLATIVENTSVFYLTLIGFLFLNQKIHSFFIAGLVLSFIGVILMGQTPQITQETASFDPAGFYWASLSALLYAIYIYAIRHGEVWLKQFTTIQKHFLMGIGLSLISLVITFFDQGFVVINNAQEWLKMFLLAAIVQVLGWSLIAKWLPKIDLSVAGIILLIQPLGSTLLGYLFLDEVLSLWQLTGALLTMIGISLGTLNKWGELSLKWKQKCKKLING